MCEDSVRSVGGGALPGREDLLVLQLLHPGGGGHRHGDHDVVDVEGALAAAPLDGLLLGHKTSVWFTSEASNTTDKKRKKRVSPCGLQRPGLPACWGRSGWPSPAERRSPTRWTAGG